MERIDWEACKKRITTIGFIAINILLFMIGILNGDLLYHEGAFSLRYLLSGREWGRIITSMFLHADVAHLGGNMLMLYMAGELVEQYIGKGKFAALYFLSGISGSLLYAAYEFLTNDYMDSIGASGAVFGLIGALLIIVMYHHGRYEDITVGRMGFMIVYMVYMGLNTPNVNNVAHIGGLLGGMILMVCYIALENRNRGRRYR